MAVTSMPTTGYGSFANVGTTPTEAELQAEIDKLGPAQPGFTNWTAKEGAAIALTASRPGAANTMSQSSALNLLANPDFGLPTTSSYFGVSPKAMVVAAPRSNLLRNLLIGAAVLGLGIVLVKKMRKV